MKLATDDTVLNELKNQYGGRIVVTDSDILTKVTELKPIHISFYILWWTQIDVYDEGNNKISNIFSENCVKVKNVC